MSLTSCLTPLCAQESGGHCPIWQPGAKGHHPRARADLAVVESRVQRGAVCDAAGLRLVELLVHASCQRVCQLCLRHHPPVGEPELEPRPNPGRPGADGPPGARPDRDANRTDHDRPPECPPAIKKLMAVRVLAWCGRGVTRCGCAIRPSSCRGEPFCRAFRSGAGGAGR